jgi:hypothetical protein
MIRETKELPQWLVRKIMFSIQKAMSFNRKSVSLVLDRECQMDELKKILESSGFNHIDIIKHKNMSHLNFRF